MAHTKSQESVLLSDWLAGKRDASQGFIHKNTSIGISSTVANGEAYSHNLTGDLTGLNHLELLKKARKTAEHVANTVSPYPVKVHLGSGSGSFNSGGKEIMLESDHFDRADLTPGQKTDILIGYAVHEAAHSLHTDFEQAAARLENGKHAELRKTINNIIEDERIEYLVGDMFPGYINYVGEVKKHLWQRLNKEKSGDPKPEEPVARVLDSLLAAVRFPSMLTQEEVNEHFEELDAIRKALTPFPMTTEATWQCTDKVIDIIRDLIKKDMEEKQQQEEQQSQQQNSEPQQEGQNASGSSSGESQHGQSGEQGPQGQQNQQSGGKGAGKSPSKKEVDQEMERQAQSLEGRNAMRRAQDCSGNEETAHHDASSLNGAKEDFVNDDRAEFDNGECIYTLFPKADKESYLRSRNNIQKHIAATSVALTYRSEDSEYCLQGMPSGKLNTNKFASYMAGNVNIFAQQGTITCDKASVCVLIDESGSMDKRLLKTREAAILINEAIKRIPKVDYYAYGFTSGKINVYCEANLTDGFALGSTEADSGTPTGVSMKMVAKRVRKYTKGGVLMLVLTDGAAHDSGEVRRQDELLRRDGIIPIGIGIETDCVRSTFKNWLQVDNLATFPQQLARLTREHLSKMLQKHDSNE